MLKRRVAVITGTRAEFGLLKPVMRAIVDHEQLELLVIAAGSHLILPGVSFREVKAAFPIAEIVPMQIAGKTGRTEDAEALARGIARFTRAFDKLRPDWVVVLGDRIEAFAAAVAASVGGWALAHIHGGDRAEGIADEAMRHAITKLAHLHLPATPESAARVIKMGERPEHVHTVGSPAIDDLAAFAPLSDTDFEELGRPAVVFLMHPIGRSKELEEAGAASVLEALSSERVLALAPNLDAGREGILLAIANSGVRTTDHLPRERLIGLFKRLAAASPRGVLVGNSSAALIECAALQLPAVDLGQRQGGRERCGNVVHVDSERSEAVVRAVCSARAIEPAGVTHPYGDGTAGPRIAAVLAQINPHDPALLRKRCPY